MDYPEDSSLRQLRDRIDLLEAEKADLEMLLQVTTGHSDEIEQELLEKIHSTITAGEHEIEFLKNKILQLEDEKADLEVIMETSNVHSDDMEDALLDKIRATIAAGEKRFRVITETIPIPILVFRKSDWAVQFSNAHAAKLLGVAIPDLMGRNVLEFIDSSENWKIRKLMDRYEFFENVEVKALRSDGSIVWIELTVQPFVFSDESCVLSVWRDTTERRMMEEHLRQTHKMEAIGTFASGIAHDFNNILSAIFGFTELSLMDIPEESPVQESLKKVLIAARRAKDLVRQILTFARQTEHEMKPIQVSLVIQEAMQLIQQITSSEIKIYIDIQNKDSMIVGDLTQIHQVVMNLCSNAIDAMRGKEGRLDVVMSQIDDEETRNLEQQDIKLVSRCVKISISDTGQGIPKEILGSIFDPFFTTKELGKGTGMGLSVVHGIVKHHGGGITVDSEVGRGTTFSIYLPLASAADEGSGTEVMAKDAKDVRDSGHLLVVDDEEAILEVYKRALEELGYTVQAENDSPNALKIFSAQPQLFDLVITNDSMPRMMGHVLATKLKAIRKDIPVILSTGRDIKQNSEMAQTAGVVDALVAKPFTIHELIAVVRSTLRARKATPGPG